jgi:hypothetical protein
LELPSDKRASYHTLLDKIPSALPFLTANTREFAFSSLNQKFTVAGSCPNINTINLPIFKALTVESTDIDAKSATLELNITPISGMDYTTLSLVYVNQQNTPVVEKLQDIDISSDKVTFKTLFPYNGTTFGNGLTIAALASGETFTNVNDVTKATIAGPSPIEIN